MDLVSIIVPIYNVELYLHQCIQSIQSQTYPNLEIILVDDGSPDNCPQMCDIYAQADSRIRVIHKSNGGLSDARNAGIEAANGKWLMFIDSDDYIDSNMVSLLHEAVTAHNAQVAICGVTFFDVGATPNFRTEKWLSLEPGIFSGLDILKSVQRLRNLSPAHVIACNKIYDRKLFRNIRYPVGKIHEDEFVAHSIYGLCDTVVCLPVALYYYRQNPDSIMRRKYTLARLDTFDAWADRILYYESHQLSDYSAPIQDSYFWLLFQKYYLFTNTKENRPRLKACRKTTQTILPFYFKRPDVSWKAKLAVALFCWFPTLHRVLHRKNSHIEQPE